jgi:hypothetical protein
LIIARCSWRSAGEGLEAAARPVEGEHQAGVESLVEQVDRGQLAQLADQFGVPAQPQIGLDTQLHGPQPLFLHQVRVRGQRLAELDVGQRGAPPQVQRLTEHIGRLLRVGVHDVLGAAQQPLEHVQVDGVRRNVHLVAAGLGEQVAARAVAVPERAQLAQLVDVGLQRGGGADRRIAAPQLVDELVGADQAVGVQHQQGQHLTEFRRGRRQVDSAVGDLDRA